MSQDQLMAVLQRGAQNPPPLEGGPQALRAWFEGSMAPVPTAEGVSIEPLDIDGLPCELLRPDGAAIGDLLLYFHGGGFVFGSPRSHRVIASNLARASGKTVLSAQYRLTPEHPAPAAHDDAFALWKWVLAQGYAPGRVAIAGDSAGGNLALATAVRARDAKLPLPGALVLLSPALDFADEGESHRSMADAPLVNAAFSAMFTGAYLGALDRRSPLATPFAASLAGLPPVLVHVGTWEFLRDDSVTIAERLRAAGVRVELKLWEGMCHNHQLWAPFIDEGMASLDEAGAFVRATL
ncbi:alpha/beta hydrolase [Pararhodobacter zhoushanensis]|uniref:Alpha/beta hydrolase n=1 Tax=Pararhodobacter zhoushanensis TaxID=2479545 RepID=A0ABT3H535_9RHOB|nr:alpha/beta hydrolase [Pararhodobacter zhoushanensis]MCW1934928.1 alpha/beta hydrolase [Pararhodobacter zhoushanensis]